MTRYTTLTAKFYQAGIEVEDAVRNGANYEEFLSLEQEFNGGSIPVHLLLGCEYKAPYSCEYHTGGKRGEVIRAIAASLKHF